jgi:hypothetical protein
MVSPSIQVFGNRGTSKQKANTVLSQGFRVSDNDYDWLGEGVYFFQDAPYRAMQWATQQHPQDPAVIRALIQLDNCIDLLDIKWIPTLKIVYNSFKQGYQRFDRPLPKQNPTLSKAHRLDCAFFNYTTELLRRQGQNMEIIRAVFVEGESIFPSSAIFDLAHIQIAVKNTELNLREYCPELFPENADLDNIKDIDFDRQAHQDSRLQIIPKLIDKGSTAPRDTFAWKRGETTATAGQLMAFNGITVEAICNRGLELVD